VLSRLHPRHSFIHIGPQLAIQRIERIATVARICFLINAPSKAITTSFVVRRPYDVGGAFDTPHCP
jgi:hypothetical protein